jgi:3-dehydroquinate dehydratase-1
MMRGMARSLAIGTLVLGQDRPRIAVPFTDGATRPDVADAVARGCDVAELRADLCSAFDAPHLLAALAPFAGVPLLATIRHGDEGGGWRGAEADRLALYRALLPRVDAIDVEIASEIGRPVIAAAREAGKLAIASFHDFAKTPADGALAAVVERGRARGADVVKIATTVASPADLRALARLLVEHDDLIVVGMGARGVASRVLFPLLGSLLTYASAGTQTAPGQLALDELVELLRRIGG